MAKYKSNKQMRKCPECGAEISLVGLPGHLKLKHGIGLNSTAGSAALAQKNTPDPESTSNPPAAQAPAVDNNEKKETTLEQKPGATNTVTEPENTANLQNECPHCKERVATIQELTQALEVAQNEINTLTASAELEQEHEIPIPDVDEFIAHCESGNCEYHLKAWQEVKERIVKAAFDNMDGSMMPDKLVEAEALKRGFIPTRIEIPVKD